MVVNDTVVIFILGVAFAFLVYTRQQFFGGMVFFVLGLVMMGYNATDNITTAIGLIMMVGSVVIIAYDFLPDDKKKTKKFSKFKGSFNR